MNPAVATIGIDISKKTFDACFSSADLQKAKQEKYENTLGGITEFLNNCQALKIKKDVPIIIESTADYHILPAIIMSEQGLNVKLINPIITKQYARSSIRKQKTDALDAVLLAKIGILHQDPLPSFSASREDIVIKKKMSAIHTFGKKRQAMKATLAKLKETFESLGIEKSPAIDALENSLSEVDKAIGLLEEEIKHHSGQSPEVAKISAIRGISNYSASLVMAYLSGRYFPGKSNLVAFAGLDLSVKESGSSVHGRRKLSKRGDPGLRKILHHIAWGLMMHNEQFKAIYEYHRNRGKHYNAALTILARKFLCVLYGMLKNNTFYDPSLVRIPS